MTIKNLGINNSVIKFNTLLLDKEIEIEISSHSTIWFADLLKSLNLDPQVNLFNVKVLISRGFDSEMGDIVTLKGELRGEHLTNCVRCLCDTKLSLIQDFQMCFLNSELQDHEYYKDSSELYVKDQVYDLNFFDPKRQICLSTILQEVIVLEIPAFPLHSEDCLGLCTVCGHDLNLGPCLHQDKEANVGIFSNISKSLN